MPVELNTHRLLSWALGLFAAYWAVGFVSQPLWYSVVISACLFVGGVFVAARSVPEALAIVRRDQIGPGELAVIALALLSAGAVWSGAFNMIYAAYDRPVSWIGPVSSFGRWMMAAGFFVFFLSPEATRHGVRWPRWYILLAGAAVIAAISFLIGYTLRHSPETMSEFSIGPRQVDLLMIRRA